MLYCVHFLLVKQTLGLLRYSLLEMSQLVGRLQFCQPHCVFKVWHKNCQSPPALNLGMEMAGNLNLQKDCPERAFMKLSTASLTLPKPGDNSGLYVVRIREFCAPSSSVLGDVCSLGGCSSLSCFLSCLVLQTTWLGAGWIVLLTSFSSMSVSWNSPSVTT